MFNSLAIITIMLKTLGSAPLFIGLLYVDFASHGFSNGFGVKKSDAVYN